MIFAMSALHSASASVTSGRSLQPHLVSHPMPYVKDTASTLEHLPRLG